MLNRQKTLLSVLHYAGGGASRLTLVKLCFLLANESEAGGGTAFYDFLPFRFGPYSFTLKHEVGRMVRDGLVLAVGNKRWELTGEAGRYIEGLPAALRHEARAIVLRYGKLRQDELLDTVYRRYEWFTTNSDDPAKRRMPRPVADAAVYTVGYQKRSVDAFLDGLLRDGIRGVVDVRHNPVARRFGFHKSTLSRLCESLGIRYSHVPQLGVPASLRCDLRTAADYARLLLRYDSEVLPAQPAALRRVARDVESRPTAILCMESDPGICHRSRVAAAVAEMTALPVVHLGGGRHGHVRDHTGADHRPHLSPPLA